MASVQAGDASGAGEADGDVVEHRLMRFGCEYVKALLARGVSSSWRPREAK
jgi:hypothetical protein